MKNPTTGNEIIIKDVIADAMLQQIITRPAEYSVLATMNLNGDYISDALAAQVGGIGIAPGANINYDTGISIFEATHGTAPKYAGQDKVNPGSLILSAEMMLRHMGWGEAADLIVKVKEPQPNEWEQLSSNQILFTYLHLSAAPQLTKGLIDSKSICIAYETVSDQKIRAVKVEGSK